MIEINEEILDPGQITGGEYEPSEEITTEKVKKVNENKQLQLSKYTNVQLIELILMQLKTILSWKHVIDKIKISNDSYHDVVDDIIFLRFSSIPNKTIDQLKNQPTFSYATDVDKIMCLSSIINVKEDKPKYINCTDQIWECALHKYLTPITLPLKVQLFMLDYNTVCFIE
ncbi:hypothetical protein F8M41_009813 [Gigaspora margarita]|uniref:Uncharacterized protein n=1 Tax=Gigaspora margarita TaxID=4874 RepID=A0A8H3X2I8_GIGMA|nr:hypothetical protein F8M41_009813 [Gigaspora margarita]